MHDLWVFDFKEEKKKNPAASFIYAFCPLREFTGERYTMEVSSVSWKLNVPFSDFYALLTSIS